MSVRYESPTIRNSALLLGTIGAACVVAMTTLAWQRVPIPDALASIGGAAVGALATLLTTFTPSPLPGGRRAQDSPMSVEAGDDVPSTAAGPGGTLGIQRPSAEGSVNRGSGN